jgi:hypothetical protein
MAPRIEPLYSELHELAYRSGGSGDSKVKVEGSDPTGEAATDVSTAAIRSQLAIVGGRVQHALRDLEEALRVLNASPAARPEELKARGIKRWSRPEVEAEEARARSRQRSY